MALLDNAELRKQFPALLNLVYLDAAHQTPLCRSVLAGLNTFYETALNFAGPKTSWLQRVEDVRAGLARILGTTSDTIAFTKNTSEGLNIAARGLQWEPGDNVILLEGEHPNNAYPWLTQRSAGLDVQLVPNDRAWADADTFAEHINTRTRAIALSHVMFHSGQRNDLASIIALAKRNNIDVVVDVMQSVGILPLDVAEMDAFAVASGTHKGLLTPQGLGFLSTSRDSVQLRPTYVAAASVANLQPDLVAGPEPVELHANSHRFEIGNFNLAAIYGLGAAVTLIDRVGVHKIEEHVLELGDQLLAGVDQSGIKLVSPREREHRSHIYVLGMTGPDWPAFLSAEGVRVSHVRDGIRVSFGLYNNPDDVDRFMYIVRRGLSNIGRGTA